jgi:hypothetical protein
MFGLNFNCVNFESQSTLENMKPLVEETLKSRIRIILIFFMVGLIVSGLTAFPLQAELKVLCSIVPSDTVLFDWVNKVYQGIKSTNESYPFLSYGTDWLAFAHLMIAVVFVGPYKDPVRNIWVVQFGMIACISIIPLAFIAGAVRGIPFYWQLIDCSFGLFGIVPLILCYKYIKQLDYLYNYSERKSLSDLKKTEL